MTTGHRLFCKEFLCFNYALSSYALTCALLNFALVVWTKHATSCLRRNDSVARFLPVKDYHPLKGWAQLAFYRLAMYTSPNKCPTAEEIERLNYCGLLLFVCLITMCVTLYHTTNNNNNYHDNNDNMYVL